MSVGSDGQNGAIVTWYGLDQGLYASRIHESVAIRGDVNVSTFVKRKANGVIEPISTTRSVGCPKGEEDALIFRVELSGQVMAPLPADALTLEFPPDASDFAFRSFRPAVADSAMVLDGDRYRTTITLRELGGCGSDSVTIMANGYPIASAPYNAISPDISTKGASAGDVGLADLTKFVYHYPTSNNPTAPYSDVVDYFSPPPLGATRPDSLISLADFSYFQSHWGHKKPADLLVAGTGATSSMGQVVLNFSEIQTAGQRTLRVKVSLASVEPFSAAYFALRNQNPLFEFTDWTQSLSYPYVTLSAPTIRDGEKLVGIGVVSGKNAAVWNGELGTIDMRVSSSAPLELTDDDFALVTGELLAVTGEVLSVSMRERTAPRKFGNTLSQNYPNPFNPTTTISYSIASVGHVDLTIFDVRGAVVRRLVNGERKPNQYHVVWDGKDNKGTGVASGVYFYRLRAPRFNMSKKMLLLK